MNNQRHLKIHRIAIHILIVTALTTYFGCGRESQVMAPLSPRFTGINLIEVPVILVGEALENCHSVGPLQTSEWDDRPVQLWKVRIKVEHVVQGEVNQKIIDVFYFVDQGPSTGGYSHLTDIRAGSSEIFFLQKDGNRWRTICEGWRSCVFWVRTGTHYNLNLDLNRPIADILITLMLSRGDHTSDHQMIDAIYHREARWGWEPVIDRLKQLAEEEKSPNVRAIALKQFHKYQEIYGEKTRSHP